MFVGHEVVIDLAFSAAQVRLASLAEGAWMDGASRGAYGEGLGTLMRVGPLGDVPGMSKLVRVHVRELVTHDSSALVTLRWEATGAGSALFPVLDADITLTPAGEDACRLALSGAYRAPFGGLGAGLDRAVMRHVAMATVRSLLHRVAAALTPAASEADAAPGTPA
jgi:hypothetical protein